MLCTDSTIFCEVNLSFVICFMAHGKYSASCRQIRCCGKSCCIVHDIVIVQVGLALMSVLGDCASPCGGHVCCSQALPSPFVLHGDSSLKCPPSPQKHPAAASSSASWG